MGHRTALRDALKAAVIGGALLLALASLLAQVPKASSADATSCPEGTPALAISAGYLEGVVRLPLAERPTVMVVTETEAGFVAAPLALEGDTGSIFGLGYDALESQLYLGTFYRFWGRRRLGLGEIYRVDTETGRVSPWLSLPAGQAADNMESRLAAKVGLGGIAIDPKSRMLYVTNLADRLIYAIDLDNQLIAATFPHGADNEPWAEDARVFGLAYHKGHLYQGIVDAYETSGRPGRLMGYVYRTRADGSTAEQVLSFTFDGPATSVPWRPWQDVPYTRDTPVGRLLTYRQPLIADLGFLANEDMVLGIRDRSVDMWADRYERLTPQGALLRAYYRGDRWTVQTESWRWFDGSSPFYSEAVQGGLAVAGGNLLATAVGLGATSIGPPSLTSGVTRIDGATGAQLLAWPLVECEDCQPPFNVLGDVEPLCGALVGPTASPTATPEASGTPRATLTPTTPMNPTPTASVDTWKSYLPIGLDQRACLTESQRVDVALVMDLSSSMLEEVDDGVTKLELAVKSTEHFLTKLHPEDQANG